MFSKSIEISDSDLDESIDLVSVRHRSLPLSIQVSYDDGFSFTDERENVVQMPGIFELEEWKIVLKNLTRCFEAAKGDPNAYIETRTAYLPDVSDESIASTKKYLDWICSVEAKDSEKKKAAQNQKSHTHCRTRDLVCPVQYLSTF